MSDEERLAAIRAIVDAAKKTIQPEAFWGDIEFLLERVEALENERDRITIDAVRSVLRADWLKVSNNSESIDTSREHVEALEKEVARYRRALDFVLTDDAQDDVEDPCGHADRLKTGMHRIGTGAIAVVRAALQAKQ